MHKSAVILFVLISVFVCGVSAQEKENIAATDKITIEGKVKNPFAFSLDQAQQYSTVTVDSIVIYNHLMQRRRSIHHIKGILLKDVLDKAVIEMPSPKQLSEIYISCIASDNYKVLFSWNELFNTAVGRQVMIITEMDGQPASSSKERITLLSAADQATGRRFMKGLAKIVVAQVQ